MKLSERLDSVLAILNSCAIVQVEPHTYKTLVAMIGEVAICKGEAQAMEAHDALDMRAARFVADTPVSDYREELHQMFAGTATASVEELAS